MSSKIKHNQKENKELFDKLLKLHKETIYQRPITEISKMDSYLINVELAEITAEDNIYKQF